MLFRSKIYADDDTGGGTACASEKIKNCKEISCETERFLMSKLASKTACNLAVFDYNIL